ncbi:hypothetical protein [Halobaculum lipolyticum]|uniref:Transporter n=1 Tax=Halobaculum lipolyticum TaxID=3032001 RepID=A0ABD5WBN0_9EURY|nr:hypothetical protein [Halobaculum sp. DT31]
MPSTALDTLRRAVPLSDRPRYWRVLLVGYAALVVGWAVLTAVVVPVRLAAWFDPLYALLPWILFALPPVVAAASALLDGGLLPALALGATPSLAFAVGVVVGRGLRALAGVDTPPADAPLWVITLSFLLVGVSGALAGFLLARAGLLAWRRVRA